MSNRRRIRIRKTVQEESLSSWRIPVITLSLLVGSIGVLATILASIGLGRHDWSDACTPSQKIDISCLPEPEPQIRCLFNVSAPIEFRFNATVPVNSDGIIPPFSVTPNVSYNFGGISFLNSTFQLNSHSIQCDGSKITSYRLILEMDITVIQSDPFQSPNIEVTLHLDSPIHVAAVPGLSDFAYKPGGTFPALLSVFSFTEQAFIPGWQWRFVDSVTLTTTGITDMVGEDTVKTTLTFSWIQ